MSVGPVSPLPLSPQNSHTALALIQTRSLEKALKILNLDDIEDAIHKLTGSSVGGLTSEAEQFLEKVPLEKKSDQANLFINQLIGKVFLLKRILNLVLARFYELITRRFAEQTSGSGI